MCWQFQKGATEDAYTPGDGILGVLHGRSTVFSELPAKAIMTTVSQEGLLGTAACMFAPNRSYLGVCCRRGTCMAHPFGEE